ncbi:MAG TPA: rod shape-determining protein MreD [Pyrinomonadaceae bacterium]|nr:rod shape-determining protein MreD [Pyrinomonadaceae bacterium]
MRLKIAVCVALAVLLQSSLRSIPTAGEWLKYADLTLIVVTYFALRRDPLQAVIIGTVAGLATDALGGGLLGAGGFSKTLTAYLIAFMVTRIRIDNPLLRIPVLASAAAFDSCVYVLLHRLLRQPPVAPFVETVAGTIIGTTITGTIIIYVLDTFFSETARQRRQFKFRRRVARRTSRGRKY